MAICDCMKEVTRMTWSREHKRFLCEDCGPKVVRALIPGLIVKGVNKYNKKMSEVTQKYIKSRYIGADGMVKCDPRYKPSEHLF